MLRNRYRVIQRLGAGGMGAVYEVEDALAGGARVALKALWADDVDEALVAGLRSEFRVMATVRHRALGRVYDFGRLPPDSALASARGQDSDRLGAGGYFLTRELVVGDDLSVAAANERPGEICALMAQACRGLDVLHQAGMRHGDFKPKNAIVQPDRRVRVIDFGLSTAERGGRLGGTPAYMAPELFRGSGIDRRADLYSVGISLHELIAGERPSKDRTGDDLIAWHARGDRPSLAKVDGVPAELSQLVATLCAARADDRVPTAGEAAVALEAIAKKLGADLPEPSDDPVVMPALAVAAVARLERSFERRRARRSGSAVVEVVGDAGSGKSTILTELAWRAQLSGAEVVRGEASAGGRALGALSPVVAQLASLTGLEPPRAADPSAAPVRFYAAVAEWLGEVSTRFPLVILVDDLDYADDGSVAMLRYLAGGLEADARVLIAVSRLRDSSVSISGAEVIDVAPLGVDEIESVVASAAGRSDPRLARRIHDHTGGNLLHVGHTLAALARRGFPPVDAGDDVELPGRLEEAIAGELNTLAADERAVCQAIAVADRALPAEVVAQILGRDSATSALSLAAARGVVESDSLGRWRFRRPATAQVVYRDLSDADRSRLHRAVLVALEGAGDADPGELARHEIRASHGAIDIDRLVRAVHWYRDSGDLCAALELGSEAVAGDRELDASLRLVLGDAARLVGDADRAEQLLGPLLKDPDLADQARLSLARSADGAGNPRRAEQLMREIMTGGDSVLAAEAARELSRLCIRHGRYDDAISIADDHIERSSEPRVSRQLVAARAYATGVLGRDDGAAQLLDEVASAAAGDGDHELRESALSYAALLAFRAGDYRRAGALYESAIEAADSHGDVVRAATLRVNTAALSLLLGDYAASHRHHVAAVAVLGAAGADTNYAIASKNLGHLLLELGETEQAKKQLEAARAAVVKLGLEVHEIGIDALLGIAAWRAGDIDAGRALLIGASSRFEHIGDARKMSDNRLDLAELELDSGDVDRARDHLERAAAIDATSSDTARRARHRALLAEVDGASGRDDSATDQLEKLAGDLEELSRQGARHLIWDLHRVAARARDTLGDPAGAEGHRRAALDTLELMVAGLSDSHRISFWHDRRRRSLRRSGSVASEVTVPDPGSGRVVVDRLYRVLDIYRHLSAERQLDRLLERVMDTAVELSGARRGFLLLSQPDGSLTTAVARNLPRATRDAMARVDSDPTWAGREQIPYSRSIAERVFHTGEPVISFDASTDPRFDLARSVHALNIERVLCFPVHALGRVDGVLYLEGQLGSGLGVQVLSGDDMRLLLAFGDQVAVLLSDARQRQELAARAEQLDAARTEIESLLAERTALLLRRTEELAIARRDLAHVNRKLFGATGAFGIVGRSAEMERVFELIARVSSTDIPVLVLGESGTGKELVARALHHHGDRKDAPLISVNCGGVPDTLLESELFGHVRGAFTGADKNRRGMFEAADSGTLFLDEIGETPPRMQASLLRALAEGVIRRVGDTRDIRVDVRVVAATNQSLETLVAEGRFREDLYYRLHVVPIEVPPLRDRADDIPLLCGHFLGLIAERTGLTAPSITKRAMSRLMSAQWPGNVRQLEHALTNACVLADSEVLDLPDFSDIAEGPRRRSAGRPASTSDRDRIVEALAACGGNKSKAARMLQIPRRTFYRRLSEYDIS